MLYIFRNGKKSFYNKIFLASTGFEPATSSGEHFCKNFWTWMLNDHGYILGIPPQICTIFAAETGGGARPMGVSPPNGPDGCF